MVCCVSRALRSCLFNFVCVQNLLQPPEAEGVLSPTRNDIPKGCDGLMELWERQQGIQTLYFLCCAYLKLSSEAFCITVGLVWQPTYSFAIFKGSSSQANDKRLSPTAVFTVLHLDQVVFVQSSCDKTLHVELRDVSYWWTWQGWVSRSSGILEVLSTSQDSVLP